MTLEQVCAVALILAESMPSFHTTSIRYEDFQGGYQIRLIHRNTGTTVTFAHVESNDVDEVIDGMVRFMEQAVQYNQPVEKEKSDA